jgi:hypothetical protein
MGHGPHGNKIGKASAQQGESKNEGINQFFVQEKGPKVTDEIQYNTPIS